MADNEKDIRVLIADDQRLVREGIASLLSLQEGIRVVGTAENGRDAVRLARELNPDVLLLDIRMPVQDGITSVEILQKNGFPGRIIMLTTFDDDEYILKSLKAGAAGYLMKDIPVDDLARAVKQAHGGLIQMAPGVMGKLMSSLNEDKPRPALEPSVMNAIAALSERERDVFLQIGRGLTNGEIAAHLSLSEGTVKNYVSGIFLSLGLRDRVQAVLLSLKWAETLEK